MEEQTTQNGVRNAQVRYNEHTKNLLTGAHIEEKKLKVTQEKKQSDKKNRLVKTRGTIVNKLTHEVIQKLETEVLEELASQLKNTNSSPQPLSPFPLIIFSIAILKDIADVFLTATIIGIVPAIALSLPVSIVLFFWFLEKIKGRWWKGKMVKWLLRRIILTITIESIPFFQVIPTTTILVLMAHFREKKTVKIFNAVLEELHQGKFKLRVL